MSEKPYRPSNGSEGEMFRAAWCDRCKRERAFRETAGDGCKILSRTFFFDVGHPKYPKEWVWDPDELRRTGALSFGPSGARCTAFEPEKRSQRGGE